VELQLCDLAVLINSFVETY